MKMGVLVFLSSITLLITGCLTYEEFGQPRPDESFNVDETAYPTPSPTPTETRPAK